MVPLSRSAVEVLGVVGHACTATAGLGVERERLHAVVLSLCHNGGAKLYRGKPPRPRVLAVVSAVQCQPADVPLQRALTFFQ